MYLLRYKNKNFAIFPKCGSTTLIKLCSGGDKYQDHGHNHNHNECRIYGTIHKCGKKNSCINKNLETVVVFRYPHERIISYYYRNYHGKLSLSDFVYHIVSKHYLLRSMDQGHHLQKINNRKIRKIKNKIFLHLKDLNNYLTETFRINTPDHKSINKPHQQNIEGPLLDKVKKYYAKEYEYLYEHHQKSLL